MFHGIAPVIVISLVAGKFKGIFIASAIAVMLKWAPMPRGCSWASLAATSMLGGIGFTVSLFIVNLSFGVGNAHFFELLNDAILGIVAGSVFSGLLGWFMLNLTLPKRNKNTLG